MYRIRTGWESMEKQMVEIKPYLHMWLIEIKRYSAVMSISIPAENIHKEWAFLQILTCCYSLFHDINKHTLNKSAVTEAWAWLPQQNNVPTQNIHLLPWMCTSLWCCLFSVHEGSTLSTCQCGSQCDHGNCGNCRKGNNTEADLTGSEFS